MTIARVCVDIPARALTEPFDYEVPDALAGSVLPGTPVLVPFGASQAVGYVVGLTRESDVPELKPLSAVLGAPLFREWAYDVASWIAEEYVSPLSEAMRLFLPPGAAPELERVFTARGERPVGAVRAAVWDAVLAAGEMTGRDVARIAAGAPAAASALVSAGGLERTYRLRSPKVGEVDDRWAELVAGSDFTPRRGATLQRAVLDALRPAPMRVSELSARLGSVDGALKRLEGEGVVRVERRRRMRTPAGREHSAPRHEVLSAGQEDALSAIAAAGPGECVLLDGVTGSGKTEVYLRAIEDVLTAGGCAVVLVPEISLTPQTVGRFRARFGDLVAVLHSRLGAGERYDQWDLARSGEARVVVGPRSALFAPVGRLDLIVIDEEHETSYKQGSAPRYHARDVARRLCEVTGSRLVMGTATPSLESIVACEQGRCLRVVLPERVGGGAMPPVRVVDMSAEFADGHRSMFSRPLLEALHGVKERGEKAVLFLNRRGYASFVLCRECGYVPGCPSCSVSLTFHEQGARLVCHHCGHSEQLPSRCPKCTSPYLRQFGAGTQRVAAELAEIVGDMPVVRMDADTTKGRGGHERALVAFEEVGSGILVGTQMIAKGLDYPDVTLVGVLNADTSLHMPDFRASERTYQMLAQVAGRAGRGPRGGLVVLQTYWPDHPAIVAASHSAPGSFFDGEREVRSSLGYPPYGRLANITLSGTGSEAVRRSAARIAEGIRETIPPGWSVLGPSPAIVAKVKRSYRWHVLVKAPAGAPLGAIVRDAVERSRTDEGVSVAPDVDPYDLM